MPETYTTISELPDYGSVQGTDRIAVDRLGAAVTASAFVVDQAYQVVTVGSTNFVAIGAASNTVGAYFVATGAGTGTGTAAPINTGDVAASAVAALATKATVGLPLVDNTSDINKPISTATQAALDAKAVTAGTLAQFAVTTSAQLAGVVSDETGSGPLVFANNPTLVTPALGTPSSVNLANATGLPLTTGVTGVLPVANGGTGTATPGLVQGANVTISGAWPNQTISASVTGGSGGSGGDALVSQPLSQFAATTSAQLRGVISDKTGTGLLYFQGGSLGTPSSVTLSNGTDLPLSTGISGLGAGIAAALAINTGNAGAPVLFNGAGGTPSALVLTNATSLPLTTGVTGVLPVTNGGTGTATPGLVQGANVTITGSWPNQTIAAAGDFLPTTFTPGTITYAATLNLDMAALAGSYCTLSLTGAPIFTTSNRASGRTVTLRVICDSTARALTFPAGWVFIGAKPSSIAASKTAVLSLTFFGTADTDCVAAYGVQA